MALQHWLYVEQVDNVEQVDFQFRRHKQTLSNTTSGKTQRRQDAGKSVYHRNQKKTATANRTASQTTTKYATITPPARSKNWRGGKPVFLPARRQGSYHSRQWTQVLRDNLLTDKQPTIDSLAGRYQ